MLLPLDDIYGEHRRQFLVKTASFLVFGYCGWVVFPSGAVLCSANRSISSSSTPRRPSDARRTLHISFSRWSRRTAAPLAGPTEHRRLVWLWNQGEEAWRAVEPLWRWLLYRLSTVLLYSTTAVSAQYCTIGPQRSTAQWAQLVWFGV